MMEVLQPSKSEEVFDALISVNISDSKLLVIHSALPSLGYQDKDLKWVLLKAIKKLVRAGYTIAIPAFTFKFLETGRYDYRMQSETGLLADWMAELIGAIRTRSPIYSFVVVGNLARQLGDINGESLFSSESIFQFFEEENATYIMLGTRWEYCTQFHKYEEEVQAPYRYYKNFTGKAKYPSAEIDVSINMYVRDEKIDPVNDWSKIELSLRENRVITTSRLWGGVVEGASCSDIAKYSRLLLSKNKYSFVEKDYLVAYKCDLKAQKKTNPSIKIAVLGSVNLDLLIEKFESLVLELIPDRKCEFFKLPYGQDSIMIYENQSILYKFNADYTFFCNRIEDFFDYPYQDFSNRNDIEGAVQEYLDKISKYRDINKGSIFINSLKIYKNFLAGSTTIDDKKLDIKIAEKLMQGISLLKDTYLVDWESIFKFLAREGPDDSRLWYVGRIPLTNEAAEKLAKHYISLILADSGRTARAIALDLDGTLWGRVLGEDGFSGIQLGGDYPGSCFKQFQQALKILSNRGIALIVLSKNNEEEVLKVWREHQDMVLRGEDFISHRINWDLKHENIEEVASEMGIGLSNILFIDDNPTEREQMSLFQPSVLIHDLPNDPALYVQSLLESPWLAAIGVTNEDRSRVESLKKRTAFLQARSNTDSQSTDFFKSLNTCIYMQPLTEGNIQRTLQLFQKTNQFNTTTKRYKLNELEEIERGGGLIYVIGLTDKYSDFENIGSIVLKKLSTHEITVDNYVMSCRFLGRGIETGVLQWVANQLIGTGYRKLSGCVVETPRNEPVRSIFASAGFKQDPKEKGRWALDFSRDEVKISKWIKFKTDLPKEALNNPRKSES
jgi:FkbH-like protein